VDATSVANEAWRARSRLRVTGADENRIQCSLHISRHQLSRISTSLFYKAASVFIFLRLGESTNPPKRASRLSTLEGLLLILNRSKSTPRCNLRRAGSSCCLTCCCNQAHTCIKYVWTSTVYCNVSLVAGKSRAGGARIWHVRLESRFPLFWRLCFATIK
jgi:hypothetical protein